MDTKLVICELLAYIFDAREHNTDDAVTDTVNTFYCEEEISTARDIIWEHYKDILHDKKKKTNPNVKLKHIRRT